MRAIAAMSAAEEATRKEKELAEINRRISELETTDTRGGFAPSTSGLQTAALAPTDTAKQGVSQQPPPPPPPPPAPAPPPAYQREESEEVPMFDFASQGAHPTIPATGAANTGAAQWSAQAPPPPPPLPYTEPPPPPPPPQASSQKQANGTVEFPVQFRQNLDYAVPRSSSMADSPSHLQPPPPQYDGAVAAPRESAVQSQIAHR